MVKKRKRKPNYWLKPLGAVNFPFIDRRNSELDKGIRFTKRGYNKIKKGDILICYIVLDGVTNKRRWLYTVAVVEKEPKLQNHSNREIYDRWPYFAKVKYTTKQFRKDWRDRKLYLTDLKKQYVRNIGISENNKATHAHNTLRAQNDKAIITKQYAKFLRTKMK